MPCAPETGLLLLLLFVPDCPAEVKIGGPTSPDGRVTVVCDFPVSQRTKNVGGTDGAGLCVFSSLGHAARWQHEFSLEDLQMKMRKEKGGGWPQKVDAMIAKYGTGVRYLQYEGRDPSVIIEALKGGRMPGVTWNGYKDPHYRGQKIAHMVNCVYHDGQTVCLLDNNFVSENDLVWMSAADFMQGWCDRNGGWAVVLCAPPPPPLPSNGVAALSPGRPFCFGNRLTDHIPDIIAVQCWGGGSGPVGPMLAPMPRPIFPPARFAPKQAAPKKKPAARPAGVKNYGLVREKINQEGECWTVNGYRHATREQAMRAIGKDDPLPQDSTFQRLTVIDTAEVCKQVLSDLATDPKLAAWKGKLVVQTYQPGNWAVDPSLGYPTKGLMIQAPPNADGRGRVLHRQAAYTGAADLAQALRRADPNYDPKKDPDLNHPPTPPVPAPGPLPSLPNVDLSKFPAWLWGALGAAGVYLLNFYKKK